MDLKRPDKVRFELEFNKETAIQVFDGVLGWKLRPYLNRKEVEPFSPKEMKIASKQGQLDGLLIDYAAKGTQVEFDSIERVEEAERTLIDPRAGVSLVAAEVSKVGKLRQTSTPKAGMTYRMAFSNTGRPVKRGDRVDVVIGHFRAPGLVVE